MKVKLKALKETKVFYEAKLKDKELTEKERSKFLVSLKIIKKIIKKREEVQETQKKCVTYLVNNTKKDVLN